TRRMSIFATARWGRTVLPPGPVYPPTSPSMFTVGCDSSRSFAASHERSSIQCCTPYDCFACASLRFRIASAIIAFSSALIGLDFGTMNELADVRRADLLFTFGDEHEVDGHLLARTFDRMQRCEKRRLRTFLVDGAASDDRFADAGFVDDARFERRRRPLGRI